MIECPICHVMNEEQAHFCSECGQRFAPAAPQPTFQNPNASAPDPVFPSFSPADKPQFQQPQAVQEYQQSSNFGAPAANSAFNNAPATSQPPQDFGNPPQQPAFNPPQTPAFNPPQTPAFNPPQTPAFNPPQPQSAPPSFDAPRQNFDTPSQPGFNPSQQPPTFNPPQPSTFDAPSETPSFNTPQDAQSKTFPPEPEAPSTPPLPARPKLHSPLFDGPDEPDTRPQAPKSGGFGGLNKPKGLRSPLLGEDDSEVDPPKPRSGGLRSPLLRGEDDPDHPQRGKGSQRNQILPPDNDPPAPTSSKGKGGLRSPLLGASDDDFVPQPKPVRPPKGLPTSRPAGGHLRSPLLGGVDDYEGDDDDDDLPPVPGKTAFPHRRPAKDNAGTPDSSDQTSSGRFPGKSGGLRSPLLGAADVDDLPSRDVPSRPTGGRPRLHSPIMDGPGSQNFEAEYDEPYYEEIDDPNVLRSPLLAARSKHVAPVAPPAAPVEPPAPPPAKIVTPAPPAQPSAAAFPSTNSFSEPSSPSAQPEFRDRGFPPAPQPPGDMWRERGFSDSRGSEPKAVTPTPFAPSSPPEVAPSIKESSPAPSLRRSSRSGLLGGASDDIDEQPINNYRNSPAPSPMPAMVLMICCIVSIPAKLWYMSIMSASMMANPGFLFEEVMQLLLLIALIFFAATAAKR